MSFHRTQIKFLSIIALLLSSLACRAATRLVIPDTPTPSPTATTTPSPTPTLPPTFTPTVIFEAACPDLLADILKDSAPHEYSRTERFDQSFNKDGDIFLIGYDVVDDELVHPYTGSVPDELKDEQDDLAGHEAIWNYFASIIPLEQRDFVSSFFLFTDGRGNYLGAVRQTYFDAEEWALHVDILDAESYYDLTYTLIHEQGHLLTLNAEQVPPSNDIFEDPDNKTVYQQEVAACSQYFPGEGCSTPDSYINQFYSRFWPDLYADWEQIDLEEDEDTHDILLRDFYKTYQDQFLSDYAATNPSEDIAESWTFFVLSPKPELDSIAHEKILFFYEYPELVELRTQILKQVCIKFPQ